MLEKYKEDYESDVNTEVTDDEEHQSMKSQKVFKSEDDGEISDR